MLGLARKVAKEEVAAVESQLALFAVKVRNGCLVACLLSILLVLGVVVNVVMPGVGDHH